MDIIIGAEKSIFDGESLTLEVQRLSEEVAKLQSPSRVIAHNSLSQLGLTESATLLDIHNNMPTNSTFTLDVPTTSPFISQMPYITQSSSPQYITGTLQIVQKGGDYRRTYFDFFSYDIRATCSFVSYNGSSVSPWRFYDNGYINNSYRSASLWGGLVSNIWVPGTYYFTSTEAANFTDLPSGFSGGFYLRVMNKDQSQTGDRIYELVGNSASVGTYFRQANNPWHYHSQT